MQRRSRSLSPVRRSSRQRPRARSLPASARYFRSHRSPAVYAGKRKRQDDDVDKWISDPTVDAILDRQQQSGAGVAPPLMDFQLRPVEHRRNWRNVLHKQRFGATLRQHRDPTPRDDLGREVTEALRRSIRSQIATDSNLTPHSTIHFTLQSDAFAHAFQSTTFTVAEFEDDTDRLNMYLQSLAAKLNSNQDFFPDDSFTMEMTFIHTPSAGSGNGKKYRPGREAVKTLLARKNSVVTIKNKDELCCARAIVTMKAWVDHGCRHPDYINLRKGFPIQEKKAKELHCLADVPEGPCGLKELQKFQDALPGYQIKVLAVDKPNSIIFCGKTPSHKRILLIKVDGHYHGCNSYGGFLSRSYFCHDCNRTYDHEDIDNHPCNGKWCRSCEQNDCPDFTTVKSTLEPGKFPNPTQPCPNCYRHFFGPTCFTAHLASSKTTHSLCQRKKKCLSCHKVYDATTKQIKRGVKIKRHRCGWEKCPFCKKQVELAAHRCFIQPVDSEDDEPKLKKVPSSEVGTRPVVAGDPADGQVWVEYPPPLFVFADFEAITDDGGVQTPILLCLEDEQSEDTIPFYGKDCVASMFEHLDSLTIDEYGDERRVIVVFHNFKGYDGMFVLQYLYATHREVEDQICIGTKVLSMVSGNLKFVDSLCFLPFPLSSFPATFGLTELRKGFFPHLFNTLDNQDYEGPMPPAEMYDPEGMSVKKKEEFERWYNEKVNTNYVFNLRREMEAYCESDVKLLKAGCLKFQAEFEGHAEFKPMEKCITIASACNRFWRKKMLPKNTIAVEPPHGWHGARTNQSVKAFKWLAWQEYRLRVNVPASSTGEPMADRIRHAGNGGEVRVFTPTQCYTVDGYDALNKTVYEFHGCLWHGCPKCFPDRHKYSKVNPDRTFQEMFEATIAKSDILFRLRYRVITIWECEWDRQVNSDPDLQAFLTTLEIVDPLEPRDAFFGGRTNAASLYYKADQSIGEQIKYVDVTSLYPWVNKNGEYPIGHPEVIIRPEDQNIHHYFGVAKVDVKPPFELYHPVLPYRHNGKLVMPLCRSCVEEEMGKPLHEKSRYCTHSPEQRLLRGTWCTPELQKAVEIGYTIITIHEVWHFPKNQRKIGLFANYVNKWLKIKQESAGYPGWVRTEDQKQQYIRQYNEREGIKLEPTMIRKNPGRKATAKLMLNSFWGKFGENLNKPSTLAIDTPAALFQVISDPLVHTHSIRICTEDKLEIVYSNIKQNQLDNGKRNVFVAAFTTCWARLKLYESLEKLGQQALYFDTDSVIYRWKPGQPEIPLGDFLGDMTDELEDGSYITEFVSGGPKNYGYTTSKGKVCCKVRGFTLNVRGSQQLNYQVMRENVLSEILDPLEDGERRNIDVENPFFFTRHPATKRLKVGPRAKQYGLVFDKRVVDPNTFMSYPYGYTAPPHYNLDDVDMINVETLLEL